MEIGCKTEADNKSSKNNNLIAAHVIKNYYYSPLGSFFIGNLAIFSTSMVA